MPQAGDGDSTALTVHEAGPLLERFVSGEPEESEATDDTAAGTPVPEADEEAADAPDDAPAGDAGDEPDAHEAPDADAEPDDEDEAPDATATQPDEYDVPIDGKVERVKLDELKKGYSREASYTRKSQKLAEERNAFEAERTSVTAAKTQLSAKLTAVESILKAQYQEPDWNKLQAENPDQFAATHAAWQIHKDRMAVVAQQRDAIDRELATEQAKQAGERLDNEAQQLLTKIPAWKDAAVRSKELSELHAWTLKQGYNAKEVDGLDDHRTMMVLRKAMLYDKAQTAAATKTAKATVKLDKVRAATPGSAQSSKQGSKSSELSRSKSRLAKSGTLHDAGEALNNLFGF